MKAVLALACALLLQPAQGSATRASVTPIPDIPGRYDAPGQSFSPEYRNTVPLKADLGDLVRILIGDEPVERKIDAAIVLEAYVRDARKTPESFIDTMGAAMAVLERIRTGEKNKRLRRSIIYLIFSVVKSGTETYVVFHTDDANAFVIWKKVAAFRASCMKDRDPRLREFFERWIPLKGMIHWKKIKAETIRMIKKIEASEPDGAELLQELLTMLQDIEEGQRSGRHRMLTDLKKRTELTPKQRAVFKTEIWSDFDNRMYDTWGNLGRKVLKEVNVADASRIKVLPFKLGWVDLGKAQPRCGTTSLPQ